MSTATTKKKWVEKEVLEDFSLPKEHQIILKVAKSTGNNLHKVVTPDGEEFLATMPLKFRKHIWIKRGDYVIAERIPEGNKVKAEIVRILMQDQIKHFKKCNVWPEAFNCEDQKKLDGYEIDEDLLPKCSDSDSDDDDDGSDVEADKFVRYNPNKYLLPHVLDNSASDSDESDDENSEDNESDGGNSGASSDEHHSYNSDDDDSGNEVS